MSDFLLVATTTRIFDFTFLGLVILAYFSHCGILLHTTDGYKHCLHRKQNKTRRHQYMLNINTCLTKMKEPKV